MACTCFKGNGDVVHKCDINVLGTSGSITDKAGVKQESLLKVAGNSKMEKNNGTDRNAELVIIIFSLTIQ
jgi:hypothetical protein